MKGELKPPPPTRRHEEEEFQPTPGLTPRKAAVERFAHTIATNKMQLAQEGQKNNSDMTRYGVTSQQKQLEAFIDCFSPSTSGGGLTPREEAVERFTRFVVSNIEDITISGLDHHRELQDIIINCSSPSKSPAISQLSPVHTNGDNGNLVVWMPAELTHPKAFMNDDGDDDEMEEEEEETFKSTQGLTPKEIAAERMVHLVAKGKGEILSKGINGDADTVTAGL